MSNTTRPYTYELAVGMVLMIGVALFGMANWSSHVTPLVAHLPENANPQTVEQEQARYEKRMADVGRDAVIPFVFCPAITFMGIFGAIVCFVWIVWRIEENS